MLLTNHHYWFYIQEAFRNEMLDKKCWEILWPENELERVHSCPICGEYDRELLFLDLVDNAFRVANGKWNLYQCKSCLGATLIRGRTEVVFIKHMASTILMKRQLQNENQLKI